jgi:predicted O-linked N-acetylglucosamine transferase (SPINDLY family)
MDFLHLLSLADVMLDPFPFCGGNTSYEALALGTPVVTMPGRYLRGRLTHGLYRRLGLTTLSVESVDQCVDVAVGLATDRCQNTEVRNSITELSTVLYENPADVTSWEVAIQGWMG